jgi:hypothetical protein
MWPFRRREANPQPADVVSGEMIASYSTCFQQWSFECDGFEFTLSTSTFDPAAFGWATEAAACIRTLEPRIHEIVLQCLPSECDATTAEIYAVDLDEYVNSEGFDITIFGDRSWGDCGVNIIVQRGVITDYYGSD